MTNATTPAPATDALQRRVEDLPPAAARLDWEDDGTPLPASSVVYMFRSREAGFPLWDEIKTQERLQLVQEAPDRFELRVLFAAPVDALARSPLTAIMEARLRLDRIEAATKKAVDGMREVAREMAVKP